MSQHHEVDIEDVEYLRHGDTPLLATVYKPRGAGPFPAVVEMHGGAWCLGNRRVNEPINLAVAAGGVVVVALDFRAPPEAGYPGSVADVNFGIRWLKANAARYNAKPEWVGAMGTSSGSHLAVLNGIKPGDSRYAGIARAGVGSDATVPYVVAMWPVICPWGRYIYAKKRLEQGEPIKVRTEQLKSQDRYWGTLEVMAEGSPVKILERGERVNTPDVLYIQNRVDELHPRENVGQFVGGYAQAGGNIQMAWYDAPVYDGIRTQPESAEAKRMVAKIVAFIRSYAK